MARSAELVCMDCKVTLWLGVAIPRDLVEYFSVFSDEKRNWQDSELNRVLWKMLADHAGHQLRVLLEWTPEYNAFVENDDITAIGHDISFEEYLKGWKG